MTGLVVVNRESVTVVGLVFVNRESVTVTGVVLLTGNLTRGLTENKEDSGPVVY